MVKCATCGRGYMTSYQEEIPNCPYCSSESHHIYHLRPGFMPTWNKRFIKLLQQQRHQPKGRVFITPKGFFVPVGGLRHYGSQTSPEGEEESS